MRSLVVLFVFLATSAAQSTPAEYVWTKLLPPVFNTTHYHNTCNESDHSYNSDGCENISEFCLDFYSVMLSAMKFACTTDLNSVREISRTSSLYKRRYDQISNKSAVPEVITGLVTMAQLFKIVSLTLNLTQSFNDLGDLSFVALELNNNFRSAFNLKEVLDRYVAIEKEIVEKSSSYIERVNSLSDYVQQYLYDGIFTRKFFQDTLHMHIMPYIKEKNEEKLKDLQEAVPPAKILDAFEKWVYPTMMVILLVFGLTGNGLLAVIFMRHEQMRRPHNVMLINLTAIDLISLVLNLPLVTFAVMHPWRWGVPLCKSFWFFRDLSLFVSIYCLVFLSYQRFQAVSHFAGKRRFTEKQTSIIMTSVLWILGVLHSLPEALFADVNVQLGRCIPSEAEKPYLQDVRLVVICLIPIVVLGFFSIWTSILIRRSVKNYPGETMGHEQRIRDRLVRARVLIGLVVVVTICYSPKHIFEFLNAHTQIFEVESFYDVLTTYIVMTVTHIILFINSAVNPIVIYLLSNNFKKYINAYLRCKFREIK